jgi:hypothetical protein
MVDKVTPDDWTPAVWSHPAVMNMQARLDPVRMTRYADDWQRAVDRIRDVLTGLNREVAAQLESSWRGDGANASLDALRRYVSDSLAGLAACRSVAVHLTELSTAAGDLRACISDHLDEALAQVRQLYSIPAVAAGNAVDDIPAPPDPFDVAGQSRGSGVEAAAVPTAGTPAAAVQPTGLAAAPVGFMPSPALDDHPRYHSRGGMRLPTAPRWPRLWTRRCPRAMSRCLRHPAQRRRRLMRRPRRRVSPPARSPHRSRRSLAGCIQDTWAATRAANIARRDI